MKLRSGFVSNSSSSSFVLAGWSHVPKDVQDRVLNPVDTVKASWKEAGFPVDQEGVLNKLDWAYLDSPVFFGGSIEKKDLGMWSLTVEKGDALVGRTTMDNFDYGEYLTWLKAKYDPEGDWSVFDGGEY